MRNLTEYSDQYILDLIEDCNANPYKCTANVQWTVGFNKLIPVLCIYQDSSIDWDNDDRCIFCEQTALIDLCEEMCMSIWDAKAMLEYYSKQSFQKNVNDIEYEIECEEYEAALEAEHSWYIKGWE